MKINFSRLVCAGSLLLSGVLPIAAHSQEQTFQAESGSKASGLSYQTTSDVGGGKNAYKIDKGDYVEWKITVPSAGQYALTARSATWATTSLQVLVDKSAVSTLSLPSTWTGTGSKEQTWASFTTPPFTLSAGSHTLRIAFTSGSQNLNWVKLGPSTASSKVEIRMPVVDDYLYLSVNGIRSRVGYYGMDSAKANSWQDISALFRNGANELRVIAANAGGPGEVEVQIRVNGGTPTTISCRIPTCDYT